eukprot:CAMPEP_0202917670 /NCGR_PEP_ID=MMETSP1392-20130828/71559_1 /ASSEMBLY_ACC=CAM_ASM_000868 /TAXON_ID=225041 /ORGANISM="Chlamydomonas chlamydogama, Strain SAG 11-48b" /LENGTH=82 /DNA_ID=CAMNT_0049610491 /DNA_START=46 /DNA_END=291 /DNA_ORIENTATION=-
MAKPTEHGGKADRAANADSAAKTQLSDIDFWVYLQPVGLYNIIATRPPRFLSRSLSYAKKRSTNVPKSGAARDGGLKVHVSI